MRHVTFLSALLFAIPAAADSPDHPNTENVTNFAFDDDIVQGDLANPNGEILRVRGRQPRNSLIRIREQFVDRLLQSAEDM